MGSLTMNDLKRGLVIVVVVLLLFLAFKYFTAQKSTQALNEVKIGLNAELSGDLSAVGDSSKKGAELFIDEINKNGGVEIAGKKYPVSLDIQDNKGDVEVTKQVTQNMVKSGDVAIVGPNASKFAIAAGEVAEKDKILLISPWSTNPKTTLTDAGTHKKYVRRVAFIDPFQGEALAVFGASNLKNTNAALMYDETADVLKGQADYFQNKFKSLGGEVVAVEKFKAGETDFSTQLNNLITKNPQVIFLPAYYQDASNIIKQARQMGIQTVFLGSDAWGSQEILTNCGASCEGSFLSAHYSAQSQDPNTQKFVESFKAKYNSTPDDVAALTYDAFGLLFKALQSSQKLTREDLVTAINNITQYSGVTGAMNYQSGNGDPKKTVVILKITNGQFAYESSVEPK